MQKIYEFLINILKTVMIVLLGILTIESFRLIRNLNSDNFTNLFFIGQIFVLVAGTGVIFSNIRNKYKIWILLIFAVVLRLLWISFVNTIPISDFESMYEAAKSFLRGDLSEFREYGYLARFPHLVPMTLYISGIIKLFSENSLLILKMLNVIFSTISVYLLYVLAQQFVKVERNKLFVVLLAAIFPAFITYTSVLCTENIAIPLYLGSLIIFFKAKENQENQAKYFFSAGVILALGNLFRGIAIVVLIGFGIYLFLCESKNKYVNILSVISGYIVLTLCVSGVLLSLNIIERPLWNGVEPSSATLLLKGTNFEHNGMWNIEDAEFVDNHLRDETLSKLCLDKVKERLLSKSPSELFLFYSNKFVNQWTTGDCGGTYWAYTGANNSIVGVTFSRFQFIYAIILLLSIVGIFAKGNNSLLCIVLFGFMLLFGIIETQSRYSYIAVFIFIILAVQGLEIILDFFQKGIQNGWNKESFRKYFFKK